MALTVKWKAPIVITSLGAREDVNAGRPRLWRRDAARHHQRSLRPQGDREGRRWPDRGRGRRRRPRRLDLALRARPGHPRHGSTARSLLSGAIATGRAVLAAQAMGADLAYIGSAFVATPEARAIEDYKQAIVAGDASDIVGSTSSPAFSATICAPRSSSRASTRTICRRASQGDEFHFRARRKPRKPRPGATSGAAGRASARSNPCSRWPNSSRGWRANMPRRRRASLRLRLVRNAPSGRQDRANPILSAV